MTTPTIADFNNLLGDQAAPPAVPYLFAGIWLKGDPTHAPGFDCSGGPFAAARKLGKAIPRTSETQFAGLPVVEKSDLRRGDAVFYNVASDDQAQPAHVAIYWDAGHVWQAPHTGEDCGIYPNSALPYPIMGYRRLPFADAPAPDTTTTGTTSAPSLQSQEALNMQCTDPDTGGVWTLGSDGHVEAEGGAPFLGGMLGNRFGWEELGSLAGFSARKDGQGQWGYDVAVALSKANADGTWFDHYTFPRNGSLVS